MSEPHVKFYTAWFCPFSQRAWIALLEKGVHFEYIEVDPYAKPRELLDVNPHGLVPVIAHGDKSVYESSICMELVDEICEGHKRLLPEDHWERAEARILGDFINKKIVPHYYKMLLNQDKAGQEKAKTDMIENLKILIGMMSLDGPYMMGHSMGYADIMLVPFTLRLAVLKYYRGFTLPDTRDFERLRMWMRACHEQEHVKRTIPDMDKLIEENGRYANNTINSQIAQAIRKGGALP